MSETEILPTWQEHIAQAQAFFARPQPELQSALLEGRIEESDRIRRAMETDPELLRLTHQRYCLEHRDRVERSVRFHDALEDFRPQWQKRVNEKWCSYPVAIRGWLGEAYCVTTGRTLLAPWKLESEFREVVPLDCAFCRTCDLCCPACVAPLSAGQRPDYHDGVPLPNTQSRRLVAPPPHVFCELAGVGAV